MNPDNVILLVEDNPDDVELIRRSFEQSRIGNDLVVVHDGAAALDWLFGTGVYADRDMSVEPALILLDVRLPKVDGFEVLERIREDERTRYYPVVILTSSQEEEDLLQGYRLGANSYVRKPVDFAAFSDAVRQVGVYWLLVNQRVGQRGGL